MLTVSVAAGAAVRATETAASAEMMRVFCMIPILCFELSWGGLAAEGSFGERACCAASVGPFVMQETESERFGGSVKLP
jgi:hypothetical protein